MAYISEQDGKDFVAVISCLVQLLIEPNSRTMEGYQSLIEREFVAMGHRFTDRCGLITNENGEQVSRCFKRNFVFDLMSFSNGRKCLRFFDVVSRL